ncbi:hypothetical protein C6P45_000173 [Maudiozyma exigua]|uniref:AAA+ ATPase domain-containing protein n=1 Tax=Maudiozyma exigua TaxID=34358 RepID=A0A9P6W9K2_MAUEX|nr:hypothetical protein C6P45_000173 [Kazachstania exigua]
MDTSTSSSGHSILTKFTKLRRKPQQPLTDLTDLYSKIAHESIFYLKLEDQKQYRRALQGWKLLTTDTIFQLTRIEHSNKNRAVYTKDELSIESGIKELYHKALKNLERIQEFISDENESEDTTKRSTHKSAVSPVRPMTARTMSAGFPRMTLRDLPPKNREPRFPFVNYNNSTGALSHDSISINRNSIDNTKDHTKRINFTTSKSLDDYSKENKTSETKSNSDAAGSPTSFISYKVNDLESINSDDLIANIERDSSEEELASKLQTMSSSSTSEPIAEQRDSDSETYQDTEFDVTDYYDDYLESDSVSEEYITDNGEDNTEEDPTLLDIANQDSENSNTQEIGNAHLVPKVPQLPPLPPYIPPIPQAPVLISENDNVPAASKISNNGMDHLTIKSNRISNKKKSSKKIPSVGSLKQTKSTTALPHPRPRHTLASKSSLEHNFKSSSTVSLASSRTAPDVRQVGSKALNVNQLEASRQAARMVLKHKQNGNSNTTREKTPIKMKTTPSASSKSSNMNLANKKTKKKIPKERLSKSKTHKDSTPKKLTTSRSPTNRKTPSTKPVKKTKSLTLESTNSVMNDPNRSMSNVTSTKNGSTSADISRTTSSLNDDSEEKKSLKETLEERIIDSIPGVDKGAAKQIFQEIVVQGDEVHWEDIAGLNTAKNSLKEAVVYPFLRPDLFKGLREPITGMLLFGPPGTGKTMLARAVAFESKSTFFSISASSLTSKYLGESEKLVRALFSVAKKLAPSIIFVDEIDSILGSRNSDGENESSRRIKNEFLIQWSSLSSAAAGNEKKSEDSSKNNKDIGAGDNDNKNSNDDDTRVLVLAATNLPWSIDEAARRRFVRRQYIPLPESETRLAQFRKLLCHQKHTLTEEDFNELINLTDGYSGSDITSLAKDAAMGPLRELGDQLLFMDRENIRPMGLIDFRNSLEYIKPSVSKEGLVKYEQWASKFGSSGI